MSAKLMVLLSNAAVKGAVNRITSDLISFLNEGHEVVVVMFESNEACYPYPENVRVISLQNRMSRSSSRTLRTLNTILMVPAIRRVILAERPQTVLSATTRPNLANVLARIGNGVEHACIICEHNFNSIQYSRSLLGKLLKHMMRLVYPYADQVLAISNDMAKELTRSFGVPPRKLAVIYNPFNLQKVRDLAEGPVDFPWFQSNIPVLISAGRLIEQKDHKLLLRAFAMARQKTHCRLLILGEGPLKHELMLEASRLKITEDVMFLGWQDNPFKYIARSRAFVLSSIFEGLPSVLIESMICGCPVISTDCFSGPREILDNGRFGLLSPPGDAAALGEHIYKVVTDEALYNRLSLVAKDRAKDFDLNLIGGQYRKLISQHEL